MAVMVVIIVMLKYVMIRLLIILGIKEITITVIRKMRVTMLIQTHGYDNEHDNTVVLVMMMSIMMLMIRIWYQR